METIVCVVTINFNSLYSAKEQVMWNERGVMLHKRVFSPTRNSMATTTLFDSKLIVSKPLMLKLGVLFISHLTRDNTTWFPGGSSHHK